MTDTDQAEKEINQTIQMAKFNEEYNLGFTEYVISN